MSSSFRSAAVKMLPFWFFIFLFKASASLHYTLLSELGAQALPLWIVGLLIGGGALVQVVLDVPCGYALDKFGYVRLLKVGVLGLVAAFVSMMFGITLVSFVLTIAFATLGWLIFGPGVNAYVLERAEKEYAGRLMSTRDIMQALGVIVGAMILPFLLPLSSRVIGFILLPPMALALVALYFVPSRQHKALKEVMVRAQGYYIRRIFPHRTIAAFLRLNPASIMLCLSSFAGSLFYGIIWFVVPIVLAQMQHAGAFGFGLAVFDTAVVTIGFLAGVITDRWDKRWLVFWGFLLFAVCAALLGFHFGVLFLVLGFLATTGDELSSLSLWAWMDAIDKNHADDALIAGAISLSEDLGWTFGPILAGFLFVFLGPSWTIAVGAGFIFITWLIACVLLRRAMPMKTISLDASFPRKRRHKG